MIYTEKGYTMSIKSNIIKKPLRTSSVDMFTELKWLTFENRCIYHMAVMTFKCKNDLCKIYVKARVFFK